MTFPEIGYLLEDRAEVEHLMRMHHLLAHEGDHTALCPRCVELIKRRRTIKFMLFPFLYGRTDHAPRELTLG